MAASFHPTHGYYPQLHDPSNMPLATCVTQHANPSQPDTLKATYITDHGWVHQTPHGNVASDPSTIYWYSKTDFRDGWIHAATGNFYSSQRTTARFLNVLMAPHRPSDWMDPTAHEVITDPDLIKSLLASVSVHPPHSAGSPVL